MSVIDKPVILLVEDNPRDEAWLCAPSRKVESPTK